MGNIVRCDRCGVLSSTLKQGYKGWGTVSSREGQIGRPIKKLDVCPECLASFERWVGRVREERDG